MIELAEGEQQVTLKVAELNQIIRACYREGGWNELHGSYTGLPDATVREPIKSDDLVKRINRKITEGHKTFKLPPEVVYER